ncbi:MAG: porin [Rhodospirillaceae bacterium]|nr:porin [Rhodospirillaceae bacterium]MYH35433.1 porin [Rhodospirillaceae bacterium]MYK14267.1 porin [Rhodospirillaceae bacterium]
MMAKPADKNIQSGNSRVKVTIYGQVNRAIRFANTGDNTEITSVDNDGSSSRIGIRATGKANANLSVGALHELEWQENRRSGTGEEIGPGVANSRVRARHVDLWLDHKDIGKLSMGHGSIAGDAAGLYELTGVSFVYGFAGANGTDGTLADASVKVLAPGQGALADAGASAAATESTMNVRGKPRGFRPFNFFGARENRIRYDTPSLMGLRASASFGENKGWSVGLTFAGAPPGVKNFSALFAAGYRKTPDGHAKTSSMPSKDKSAWALSGGIKHSSGFNVSGHFDSDGEESNKGVKNSQWGVSGGWSGKINDAGGTSIGIGYNRSTDGMEGVAQQYWVAIVQKVDAAAADVYAGVSYDSGTLTHVVSAAEAANEYTAAVAETQTVDGASGFRAKATPCYTRDPDTPANATRAAAGDTCQLDRDGVINFVAGVRVKF